MGFQTISTRQFIRTVFNTKLTPLRTESKASPKLLIARLRKPTITQRDQNINPLTTMQPNKPKRKDGKRLEERKTMSPSSSPNSTRDQ